MDRVDPYGGQEPRAVAPPWHTAAPEAVLERLASDPERGLSAAEVERRRQVHGPNTIRQARRKTLLAMVASQLASFMILVLLAAALVSGLVGDWKDTVAILVIVVLNAAIGSLQEYRAERAVAALRRLAAPHARVRRDGEWQDVEAAELVPGDVVALEAGGVAGADARLLSVADLAVDEALLTGESVPARKRIERLAEPDAPVGDRLDMVFRGTLVTGGRGRAVVVSTGMETELGRIAELLQEAEAVRTPLQLRLARFGRHLALAVLAICAVVFAAGILRGEAPVLMFLTAVTLAVAAIPEALPAVVTVSLALGARKMIRRNALIRRLPAVETLGSVTFVCADKTGTLTRNEMTVDALVAGGVRIEGIPASVPRDGPLDLLLRAMVLNNDVREDGERGQVGDPTEIAILRAAVAAGLSRPELARECPRIGEIAFDEERRRMTTLHPRPRGGVIVFVKGAPEVVLERCSSAFGSPPGDSFDARATLDEASRLAAEGFRVLAFACRPLDRAPERVDEGLERELAFLGLVALFDPPREGAAEAVASCRAAGITPVMITGDHPHTARAIARRIGILPEEGGVLTGKELVRLSPEELPAAIRRTRVYARVSPQQKIDIVRTLQSSGEFVAMTGDGVNDAPALKRAEIGIAMGKKGTEVAREAADMVLLDDDFATIVAAVREGRRVYDNIRKFVKYTLTSNSGEIWTLFLAPFLGLPVPLLPIQILWINLVTDGLPGLALAVEPEERDLMRRPPRRPGESLFAGGMWQHVLWVGLLIAGLSISAQAWAYHSGSENWQSVVFTVLTLSQLVHALVIRSERESLFLLGLRSNLPLLGAVVLTVLLQLGVLYVPTLQPIFGTSPLSATELAICFALPALVFVAVEIEKAARRRSTVRSEA